MSEHGPNPVPLAYAKPSPAGGAAARGSLVIEVLDRRVVVTVCGTRVQSSRFRLRLLTRLLWHLAFLCFAVISVARTGWQSRQTFVSAVGIQGVVTAGVVLSVAAACVLLYAYHHHHLVTTLDARPDGLAVTRRGPFGASYFGRRREKLRWVGVVAVNTPEPSDPDAPRHYALRVDWAAGSRRFHRLFLHGADPAELRRAGDQLREVLGLAATAEPPPQPPPGPPGRVAGK